MESMEIVLLVSWGAICCLMLWLIKWIEKKGKIRQGMVSDADKLTQSEEYSRNLEHCAQQLAEITELLQECRENYDAESDEARRAEIACRMELLQKKQELTQMKCSNLLRKLD